MLTGVEESNASENDVAQVETRHENEEAAHAVDSRQDGVESHVFDEGLLELAKHRETPRFDK